MLLQRGPGGFPRLWNAQFVLLHRNAAPSCQSRIGGAQAPGNATAGMLSPGHSWNSSLIAPTWILAPGSDPPEHNVALWGANPGNFLLQAPLAAPLRGPKGSPAAGNESLGCLSPSPQTPQNPVYFCTPKQRTCAAARNILWVRGRAAGIPFLPVFGEPWGGQENSLTSGRAAVGGELSIGAGAHVGPGAESVPAGIPADG